MVNIMDDRAQTILDEGRATVERLADFEVEHREHRTDGFSTDWAKGMPPKPPPVSIEYVRREIAEAMAKRPNGLTSADVEALVAAKFATHDDIWHGVIGEVIAQMRRELQTEIAKAAWTQGSNEMFYLDANGRKQDRELHGPILRAVDGPFIDEKIMGPIRAKHRAKYLAERRSQRRA